MSEMRDRHLAYLKRLTELNMGAVRHAAESRRSATTVAEIDRAHRAFIRACDTVMHLIALEQRIRRAAPPTPAPAAKPSKLRQIHYRSTDIKRPRQTH